MPRKDWCCIRQPSAQLLVKNLSLPYPYINQHGQRRITEPLNVCRGTKTKLLPLSDALCPQKISFPHKKAPVNPANPVKNGSGGFVSGTKRMRWFGSVQIIAFE
jgi:hypothetical protein